MISIFKRRKRDVPTFSSPSWLQNHQRKWADRLTRFSENLSTDTKRLLLVLFCINGLLYCSAAIWKGTNTKKKAIAEQHQIIATPRLPQKEHPVLDTALQARLKIYKQKIDNLRPEQRQKLMETRPGLLDSLQRLEAWMNKN
ncbi:MAG TPA: hypothetical protein VN040_14175 [Pseudosphingobacterium sp.]|nr:hypothetical protein [Pseudosphingobacterium sp.]